MDIDHLRTFAAVAGRGSFTGAATALGESQPLVSKRIGALERELGVRLFERSAAGTVLTPAGELLIQPVRGMLETFDAAMAQLGAFKRSRPARVVVKTFKGYRPADDLLLAARAELAEAYPRLEMDVRDIGDEDLVEELRLGNVDLALFTPPPDGPSPAGMACVDVLEEPVVAIASRGYPLADREEVSLADLDGRLVWVSEGGNRYFTRYIKHLIADAGACPEFRSIPWAGTREFYNAIAGNKGGVFIEFASAARHSIPTMLSGCRIIEFAERPRVALQAVYRADTANAACVDAAAAIARIAGEADLSVYW